VDMGFPADKARQALESTSSGTDVQAAVGWLLNRRIRRLEKGHKVEIPVVMDIRQSQAAAEGVKDA